VTDASLPIHARALLEHQEFVRALAKHLLRDEHAAEDVAQETALTLLTRPPQALDSVRGWIAIVTRNKAHNLSREKIRRARREETVARDESDDSETALHERLSLQQKVVEAVIGLREPYKSVVVLAYYEGLSAAAIAERRNVPAGTVRAQLSRALQMLREKLDHESAGGRGAWSAGLFGLLKRSSAAPHVASSAKVLVAATAIFIVSTTVAGVWILRAGHAGSGSAPIALNPVAGAPATAAGSATDATTAELASVGHAGEQRVRAAAVATNVNAEGTIDELLRTGQQIQLLLRARLLTPDPALLARARCDSRICPLTAHGRRAKSLLPTGACCGKHR
jgi:RNA polymerase sigma factor (sigma-70 family)